MTLPAIALTLSALGVLITAGFAVLWLRDPASAMGRMHHRPEALAKVLTDRYVGNALLALGATLYGDFLVIAGLFAVFAFESFADVALYARRAQPYLPHLWGGIGAALVAVTALFAHLNGAA